MLGKKIKFLGCLKRDIKGFIEIPFSSINLISYPKSGATWLQAMLANILIESYKLNKEGDTVRLTKLCKKYPEIPQYRWSHDGGEFILESEVRPDPTILFHYPFRFKYAGKSVVLLIRDPRDVLVSYYHQATKRSANPMHFDDIGDYLKDRLYGVKRISRFMKIWDWNKCLPHRFIIVRYEDLLNNTLYELKRILEFSKICYENEQLRDIVEKFTAEKMREQEKKGNIDGMRKFGKSLDHLKVRKARSGTYKEELSSDDIAYCNKELGKVLKLYGYPVE